MRLFFIYFCGTWIQTTKFFCHVRTFPSLDTMCRLWGIRDDFAALYFQNLLIVAPTKDKGKTLISGIFLFKILDNYVLCVTVPLRLKLGV